MGCGALRLESSANMALAASGRTTGVSVGLGECGTTITAVYEGIPLAPHCEWLPVGGEAITHRVWQLAQTGTGSSLLSFTNAEALRQLKERSA